MIMPFPAATRPKNSSLTTTAIQLSATPPHVLSSSPTPVIVGVIGAVPRGAAVISACGYLYHQETSQDRTPHKHS